MTHHGQAPEIDAAPEDRVPRVERLHVRDGRDDQVRAVANVVRPTTPLIRLVAVDGNSHDAHARQLLLQIVVTEMTRRSAMTSMHENCDGHTPELCEPMVEWRLRTVGIRRVVNGSRDVLRVPAGYRQWTGVVGGRSNREQVERRRVETDWRNHALHRELLHEMTYACAQGLDDMDRIASGHRRCEGHHGAASIASLDAVHEYLDLRVRNERCQRYDRVARLDGFDARRRQRGARQDRRGSAIAGGIAGTQLLRGGECLARRERRRQSDGVLVAPRRKRELHDTVAA